MEGEMSRASQHTESLRTGGIVLHSAAAYDVLLTALSFGRERALRRGILNRANLKLGERVLDIGCGTGTTAIIAKELVGAEGSVCGIDASLEMIARARRKAFRARVQIDFVQATVETLPFPDGHFDAVLSSMMLHHLPAAVRRQCGLEVRRVLKPGGRVFAVDFTTAPGQKGIIAHFHRHGHISFAELVDIFREARMTIQSSGAAGVADLHYVIASVPDIVSDQQLSGMSA
jgi:ubiquinone/menaquinone biosynthesis C-methylase UbiE